MRNSWSFGRLAGIDIFVHPTFVLLLLYVGVFEGGFGAIALTVSAFGCVLLHELGHALMARRFGIGTLDITLYPIGGIASLERIPCAPGAEFLVAVAGPAVNFAIAGMLYLWGAILSSPLPIFAEFLTTLLIVNLGLGLFNLLPAFPMDGGRVMRALLSGWLGRLRATEVSVAVARGLALLFGTVALYNLAIFQLLLAMMIYILAGRELASVRASELNRVSWPTAPDGFRWLSRGDGTYRLEPILIPISEPRRCR